MNPAFKTIDWGQDFAKGDPRLKEYFVHFPEFNDIVSGSKRYVIGRKGAGKTAVIEKLRLEQEVDAMKFNADISLRNFPINDLMEMGDKSFADKSKYVSAWLFIVYVELAKIILQDNGAAPSSTIEELRDFLETNHLNEDIGFVTTVEKLKSAKSKVSVLPKWAGAEFEDGSDQTARLTVHYHKIVSSLGNLVSNVNSDSEYWIFVDELDEGYRAGASNLRLVLLALIRAIEEATLKLRRSGLTFRPLLVLRSDIFDSLEDNDLNKLDDFVVRLRWVSQDTQSQHSLMRIAEERIRLQYPGVSSPWEAVVDNLDPTLPREVSSVWQYIVNRTFDRPRDLIKFLKFCRTIIGTATKLTFDEVKEAEHSYSNWLQNEIRDEIYTYLPIWRECFQAITRIGTGKVSVPTLKAELESVYKIHNWLRSNGKSADEILDLLFDFGVLGYFDGHRWIFKHKDDDLTRARNADLIIHYGLYKKLRLRHGAKKM